MSVISDNVDVAAIMARGGLHVTSTAAQTAEAGRPWQGLFALAETEVATVTCPLITGAALANITIPAGLFYPFPGMTGFQLTSGDAIAVNQ